MTATRRAGVSLISPLAIEMAYAELYELYARRLWVYGTWSVGAASLIWEQWIISHAIINPPDFGH